MKLEEVVRALGKSTGAARETIVLDLDAQGASHVEMLPVRLSAKDAHGVEHRVVYTVSADYYALGMSNSYLRMPMYPGTAQKIADRHDWMLPTPRMVDQFATVAIRVPMMTSATAREATATYVSTNAAIDAWMKRKGMLQGLFTIGQRKDIVITDALASHSNAVIIYGGWDSDKRRWWQTVPNYKSHNKTYVDYSHGWRAVSRYVSIDETEYELADVLKHPTLFACVSESPILTTRYPTN